MIITAAQILAHGVGDLSKFDRDAGKLFLVVEVPTASPTEPTVRGPGKDQ